MCHWDRSATASSSPRRHCAMPVQTAFGSLRPAHHLAIPAFFSDLVEPEFQYLFRGCHWSFSTGCKTIVTPHDEPDSRVEYCDVKLQKGHLRHFCEEMANFSACWRYQPVAAAFSCSSSSVAMAYSCATAPATEVTEGLIAGMTPVSSTGMVERCVARYPA